MHKIVAQLNNTLYICVVSCNITKLALQKKVIHHKKKTYTCKN